MNWGHKITIAFIFFGVFIISLVVVCVRADFHLVSPDYYQQTLDFETQIIQAKNAQELLAKPEVVYTSDTRQLELIFPKEMSQSILEGEVVFYRPSDANKDFKAKIALDINGRQKVDINGRDKGLWKLELSWKDQNKEYYMEQKIYL